MREGVVTPYHRLCISPRTSTPPCGLEIQLQGELPDARTGLADSIALGRERPEVAVTATRTLLGEVAGRLIFIPYNRVDHVEELGAELQLHALGDDKILMQPCIPDEAAGIPELAFTDIAKRPGRVLRKRSGIQPAAAGLRRRCAGAGTIARSAANKNGAVLAET